MPTNETRRELLNRVRASGYPGSITEVFQASDQGIDLIEQHQLQQQQEMQVAQTQQQEIGLREEYIAGNTDASMAFPDVQPNQSSNTVGMLEPIDIQKIDDQGHLVESYKNVPPGIQDLPTGPSEGTVIESPAAYQKGGFNFNKSFDYSSEAIKERQSRSWEDKKKLGMEQLGYKPGEGKDLVLDAGALFHPGFDLAHAATKFQEGKYLESGLYGLFALIPGSAGPLVQATKTRIKKFKPVKNLIKDAKEADILDFNIKQRTLKNYSEESTHPVYMRDPNRVTGDLLTKAAKNNERIISGSDYNKVFGQQYHFSGTNNLKISTIETDPTKLQKHLEKHVPHEPGMAHEKNIGMAQHSGFEYEPFFFGASGNQHRGYGKNAYNYTFKSNAKIYNGWDGDVTRISIEEFNALKDAGFDAVVSKSRGIAFDEMIIINKNALKDFKKVDPSSIEYANLYDRSPHPFINKRRRQIIMPKDANHPDFKTKSWKNITNTLREEYLKKYGTLTTEFGVLKDFQKGGLRKYHEGGQLSDPITGTVIEGADLEAHMQQEHHQGGGDIGTDMYGTTDSNSPTYMQNTAFGDLSTGTGIVDRTDIVPGINVGGQWGNIRHYGLLDQVLPEGKFKDANRRVHKIARNVLNPMGRIFGSPGDSGSLAGKGIAAGKRTWEGVRGWFNQKGGFNLADINPTPYNPLDEQFPLRNTPFPQGRREEKKIRRDELKSSINKVVSKEPEKNQAKLQKLLEVTNFMENSMGYNPNAYNRTYTNSQASIDPIMLNDLFDTRVDQKGIDRGHTETQKKYFAKFKELGLPTNKEAFKKVLQSDNSEAAINAMRMVYGRSSDPIPAITDTSGMFKYYDEKYRRNTKIKNKTESRKRFYEGYKMKFKRGGYRSKYYV
tara:strand:+ start:501 stop:3173 length:2673 start_codon:yes stop_codon:yes gene_type:complete